MEPMHHPLQPRLFRVTLAHPVHFHMFPQENGYLRLRVTVQQDDQIDAETFVYDSLTIAEAADVVCATLGTLQGD